MTRRDALGGIALFSFAIPFRQSSDGNADERFSHLEAESGGRLGVAILDSGSGRQAEHRADERFPMCSTFKLIAVAAVLARVDRGVDRLDRRIAYGKPDLLEYAPVTTARVSEGSLSLAALCEAAITVSDNTAANLILQTLGGPGGVTTYARSLGDSVTRLDRMEPALNEARPGDGRDTTTPRAMMRNLQRLIAGDALSSRSRATLTSWLVANQTGGARLRAGLPADWRVGDKTGTGNAGTTNDVAALWPPRGEPVFVAAYLTESSAPAAVRERTLADVARAIAAGVSAG
jgi:beta-lactamase class A